jgi:hypothetical protein
VDVLARLRRPAASGPGAAPGRRGSGRRAFGVTAVLVAGGAALSGAFGSSRARGATTLAAGTTVGQGAIAPTVVRLADAPTIAVDASLGNDFRVTLGTSRTMGNPANPADGQRLIFQITQGGAGPAGITWDSAYDFSPALPQPSLSAIAGHTDLLGFTYYAAARKWRLAAFVNGFS